MISNPHAEASANGSSIPAQGTSPSTTSTEHINGHAPGSPSSTPQVKPLSQWDQVELIQNAMKEHHRQNFDEWGNSDLGCLLSPYKEGASLNAYVQFFRDLLLFLSKPKISARFDESVPRGLNMIKLLSGFFLELQRTAGYEEFAVYHSLFHFYDEQKVDFLGYAEKYLTGAGLQAVLAANGKEPATGKNGPASVYGLLRPEYLKSHLSATEAPAGAEQLQEKDVEQSNAWARQMDEGPHQSKYFKTEEELIATLDRFYCDDLWPTSKALIVQNRLMAENLDRMEEDRLKIRSETVEQVKKRLANEAVRNALNLPAVGLHTVTAIESAMLPPETSLPRKTTGATAPKKPAATASKKLTPARKPAKKPAPKKKA